MQVMMPEMRELFRILDTWFRDKGDWWNGCVTDVKDSSALQAQGDENAPDTTEGGNL